MGILLMILGLASAGLVADLVLENHLTSAHAESFNLIGTTVHVSTPVVILGAFAAGALTVVLLAAGTRLARQRRTKRRALRLRLADLEAENARLRMTEREAGPEPSEPARDTLSDSWAATPASKR